MSTFRIRNPRNRSDRVLIRMTRGQNGTTIYVTPSVPAAPAVAPAQPEKKKTKISIGQIKQVLHLLEKSKKKNLTALLSGGNDDDVDMDELSDAESDASIEEVDDIEEAGKEEKDVLIIDL